MSFNNSIGGAGGSGPIKTASTKIGAQRAQNAIAGYSNLQSGGSAPGTTEGKGAKHQLGSANPNKGGK